MTNKMPVRAECEKILIDPNSKDGIKKVMDYMQKRMDQIDETRRSFKVQYPDLLPNEVDLEA